MSKTTSSSGWEAAFGTPHDALEWMIDGRLVAELVYVAVTLKLPDLLRDGPRTATDLVDATGANADALPRMLRALVWCGILAERDDGRFELAAIGDLLRGDSATPRFRLSALVAGYERRAFTELHHMALTGEAAFDIAYGMGYFDYLRANPEFSDVFSRLMQSLAADFDWTRAVVEAYDFSQAQTIVDIGGGRGHLLAGLLQAHPTARGVLFDLPDVVEQAQGYLTEAGVAARCAVIAGDFFTSMPPDGDHYVIKHVLNDWDDERCVQILRNCVAVLPPGGRVLVINSFLPERATAGSPMFRNDVHRMIQGSGRERTHRHFETLFDRAGLRLAGVYPANGGMHVLEGVPA
jgi:predicted O-methyltransferase YrrM